MQRKILITGAAIAALMTAAPALAQTASEGVDLSELVVTAQKREQKLQDVPAAISVLSGDALAARGSVNLESAQYLVPTLNFRKYGTPVYQTLFLRGVQDSDQLVAGMGFAGEGGGQAFKPAALLFTVLRRGATTVVF